VRERPAVKTLESEADHVMRAAIAALACWVGAGVL
jgi:hypothetical protein